MPLPFDHQTIKSALKTWFKPGDVFEIRILEALTRRWNAKPHTEAGYFDYEHIDLIPGMLEELLVSYKGIYVTANPLTPAVIGRSMNRFKNGALIGAKDDEVAARRWLLVDCDAKRVSGVSASDEEHAHALAKAQEIKTKLAEIGWPLPIELDSGNGAQLMYRVDLPAHDDGLIKRCLEQLKLASDEHVEIDQTVFNAARIWRLPGAWNCKGDECESQTRVHRQARILAIPPKLEAVPLATLEAFAPKALDGAAHDPVPQFSERAFDVNLFIADHFPDARPQAYAGGTKWVLDVCPFDPNHNNRSAIITQSPEGKLGFKCHHNGCSGKNWHDLRALLAPKPPRDVGGLDGVDMSALFAKLKAAPAHEDIIAPQPKRNPLEPPLASAMLSELARLPPSATDMLLRAPAYAPAIVDGLFREREVVNIVAAPKTGKSWLVLHLALSIARGRPWMGYNVAQAPVYMIDNELHETAFAQRLAAAMHANKINRLDVEGRLYCRCVRTYMPTLDRMLPFFDEAKALGAKVIVIDAMYRALPRGCDENSNSDMRDFYNALNRAADYTGAAIVLVHHTSKGIQAGKSVTDLGAGAGAISRAADTHIALRQHLHAGVVVFDAVTRTFPKGGNFCIQCQPPLLVRDDMEDPRLLDGLTPAELRRLQGADIAEELLANAEEKISSGLDVSTVLTLLEDGPMPKTFLLDALRAEGASARSARALINAALDGGKVCAKNSKREDGRGYHLLIEKC